MEQSDACGDFALVRYGVSDKGKQKMQLSCFGNTGCVYERRLRDIYSYGKRGISFAGGIFLSFRNYSGGFIVFAFCLAKCKNEKQTLKNILCVILIRGRRQEKQPAPMLNCY